MRYLAIILLFSIGNLRAQSDTTKYFTSNDYGWKYKRVYTPLVLAPPQDTLYGKWGIAQKGSSLFVGNGTRWTVVGGSSIDTNRLVKYTDSTVKYVTPTQLIPYLQTGTDISVKSVQVTGTNSNGHIGLRHQTSNPTSQGQTSTLFAASDGRLKYKNDGLAVDDIAILRDTATVLATQSDISGFATISSVNSALGLKVNISDTGTMLNGYLRKADTIRYATALNSKLNISDTLAMLDGRLSSITLNTSGSIHNNPINFSRLGGAWSGTMSLANQSPFTVFRRGSGTGTPSFGSIDSSYFGGNFATQVRAAQQVGTYAQMLAIASPTEGQQFICTDYIPGLWVYTSFGAQWQCQVPPLVNGYAAIYNTGGIPNLTQTFSGTGATNTIILNDAQSSTGGVADYSTGTTTTGSSLLGFFPFSTVLGFRFGYSPNNAVVFRTRVKLNQLSNATNSFYSSLGSRNPTGNINICTFLYSHDLNGGNWTARTRGSSGVGANDINTGIAADLNWHEFVIMINNTSARFYIDGVLVATSTTSLPNSGSTIGAAIDGILIIKRAGTTSVSHRVDYFKVYNYNNN